MCVLWFLLQKCSFSFVFNSVGFFELQNNFEFLPERVYTCFRKSPEGPYHSKTRVCVWSISELSVGNRNYSLHFKTVVELLSHVWLFATPWTAAHQASLSFTVSQSLLKLTSIESVMPSNHLVLCHPLFRLPSICPSIWVFSKASSLRIRWPKYWSFSFSISPSNEYSGLISKGFKTGN